MRRFLLIAVVGVLVVVAFVAWGVWHHVAHRFVADECTARVGGRQVTLDPQQARNAALIAAISVRRGMPARAATIALATAYQESKLVNLSGGDRDSLGLFQQRPSQGWGTPSEIERPAYAINAFYDALEKVDGYTSLPVTEAAQEVQRSGFPEAYAVHEPDARVLASALTGNSPAAFWCRIDGRPDRSSVNLDDAGLTARAAAVRRDVEAAFGPLSLGGFAPGGVRSGHMAGSAHYEGRAVDIFVRPVGPDNRRRGWAIAQYLVARADRLDIHTVIFDARIWTAGSSSGDGWRPYTVPRSTPGDRSVLLHRDHVHVDVFS